MPWYEGKTLAEAIDDLVVPERWSYKPLRISIRKIHGKKKDNAIVDGRIISGKIKNGMHLVISPGSMECTVKSIEICDEKVDYALSGDLIGLRIEAEAGSQFGKKGLGRGYVISKLKDDPAYAVEKFLAKITIIKRITIDYAGEDNKPYKFG